MFMSGLCLISFAIGLRIEVRAEFRQEVFEILPSKEVATIEKIQLTRSLFDCADMCMTAVNCSTATYNSYNKKCFFSTDRPRNFIDIADNNIVTITLNKDTPVKNQFGTSFLTGFMSNGNNNGGIPHLLMVSPVPTNVSVTIPYLDIYQELHIVAGFLYLQYSTSLMPAMSSVVSLKGVEVIADQPITLYSMNYQDGSADGTLEIPKGNWGQLYIVDTHNSTMYGVGQILIIAAYNDTEVTLEFPTDTNETVMLNKFETYQRQADVSHTLAGTIVSANSSIAVHAGHMCANVPDHSVVYCDTLMAAVPPVNTLSRVFVVPYQRNRTSYSIGVTVPFDGTVVTIWDINGTLLEYIEMDKQDSIFKSFYASQTISVTSTQDILVTQYSHGSSGYHGDPSITIIPAVKQFGNQYNFAIPAIFDDPSVVPVMMRSIHDPTELQLNGSPLVVTESASVCVPGEGIFNVVYIDVNNSVTYSLSHTDPYANFGAILYARNTIEEYTTALGYNL